ncbi:MAG: 1,4-dihydroxy-6-naphthoate synthase [Planctomycetota bacterium]
MTTDPSTLTIGLSPCPNDTFMFHGLLTGLVPLADLSVQPHLLDIEELNRRALDPARALAVTKLSVAAYGRVRDRYDLLDSGAAMGSGCGPLVVRGRERNDLPDLASLSRRRIAIPGELTTAALLLRLLGPADAFVVPMRFDLVMPAVQRGAVDAGVIIHESRFTYENHGLVAVADLGSLWELRTKMPIPLGVVAARRDLGSRTRLAVSAALRASIALARRQPHVSAEFVRQHARELSEDVCRRHIDLYVNDWSESMGPVGRLAIQQLLEAGDSVG